MERNGRDVEGGKERRRTPEERTKVSVGDRGNHHDEGEEKI